MARFKISKSYFGEFEEYTVKNLETHESFKVVSGFGCNLRELSLKSGIHVHSLIHGHVIPSKLRKKYSTCAMLTPFTGRIPDGVYSFQDQKYQLEINKPKENVAIHGLVYDKPFSLVEKIVTNDSVSLHFEYLIKEDMFHGYPFNLLLKKIFTFSDRGLEISTEAKNVGSSRLPFGDGWHPHFSLGNNLGNKIDDLVLELRAKSIYNNTRRKVVSSKKHLPKSSKYNTGNGVIGKRVFDNCYTDVVRDKDGYGEASLYHEGLKMVLWFDSSYNYIQIYTPDDRKSIAIEPMTSTSNSFNNKNGLIVLGPGDEFKGKYGIYLESH